LPGKTDATFVTTRINAEAAMQRRIEIVSKYDDLIPGAAGLVADSRAFFEARFSCRELERQVTRARSSPELPGSFRRLLRLRNIIWDAPLTALK